jgi:hypothetical protein
MMLLPATLIIHLSAYMIVMMLPDHSTEELKLLNANKDKE